MKTLNINISELEFRKFKFKKEKWSFSEFLDLISKELKKDTLEQCLKLAEKYGLSEMTMKEISREVKATRKNAKSNS
jgi:hypothetical protein